MAPRWRLRPGRRAPRRFSGASVPAVSGPVLAGFGRFRRPPRRTSTPSGARRGPRAAARPRRGSPGPVGPRRCDLRAAPGAVGWQGAVCPRRWRAGAGPGARFPPAARPAASPRPRAALARRPLAALTPRRAHGTRLGPRRRLRPRRGTITKTNRFQPLVHLPNGIPPDFGHTLLRRVAYSTGLLCTKFSILNLVR